MTNNKQKILFIHSSAEMYGSDRCFYELLKNIDKKRYFPIIVLPFKGPLFYLLKKLRLKVYITDPWVIRKRVVQNAYSLIYFLKLPYSLFNLIKIINKEEVKLIYSNTSVIIGGALAAFLTKKPHIFHVREIYNSYLILNKIYPIFIHLFSKKIIAVSKAVYKSFKYKHSNQINLIYDGIDLQRFQKKLDLPKKLIKLKNNFIISNISRISKTKGQDIFIKAAKLALENNKNLHFLIVGDVFQNNKTYFSEIKNLIKRLGIQKNITFTGYRQDVENYFFSSDIIVLTTVIEESLSQTIMEAMALGKVVIAPNAGGPKELIDNNINGILYTPSNYSKIAQIIINLINNPQKMEFLGKNAKNKAFMKFCQEKKIKEIQKTINFLLT